MARSKNSTQPSENESAEAPRSALLPSENEAKQAQEQLDTRLERMGVKDSPTEAKETKKEAPATSENEKSEQPKAPELDVAKLEAEITERVTKSTVETMMKRIMGQSESQATKETGVQSPWAKEGRNPKNWDEIAQYVSDITQAKLEEQNRAKSVQEAKTAKEQQEAQEKAQGEAATLYQSQLTALQEAGKVPKGEENAKDFWTQAATVSAKLASEGKPPIRDVNEFFVRYYKAPSGVPGQDLPIAGKSGMPVAQNKSGEYSHRDIRNARSIHDLVS